MKKNFFIITISCLVIIIAAILATVIKIPEDAKGITLIGMQVLGFLYLIAGFIYLPINLFCFYLVYKYARGDRLSWFLGLIFLGIIIVPIVAYHFSHDVSPFRQKESRTNRDR